ncbi:putative peptidoglycan binding domain protein [Lysobacter antibioticus]|uniref:peptidoglycan-binding domain-containing protein n=1 Tax=Lysobacter antibioticus TaxID=84531 RepID=UPI000722E507|nr:peptidoglycan-binding domain-containing protein [Lysobacter antibioticus]ALN65261.1 putative peptidoglycan binding domain protein [Lysobacter antibioticus]
MSREENWEQNKGLLAQAATEAGIDPGIMARIAGFESGFRTDARPVHRRPELNTVRQFDGVMAMSTGYGLGQFLDGTWKEMINAYGEKYGVADASRMTDAQTNDPILRTDPAIQAAMLAEFTRENIDKGAALGGTDADANVYAFHNLGAGDAKRFLRALAENPSQPVDGILSGRVIRGNPSLYGDGSRTVGEAYGIMGGLMRQYEEYAVEAVQMTTAFRGVPYANPEHRPLNAGSKGHSVKSLQQDLNAIGATDGRGGPLVADGAYGHNTREAVGRFQQQNNLSVTGNADSATLAAISAQASAVRSSPNIQDVARKFQPAGFRQDWLQTDESGLPNYLYAAAEKPRRDDPQQTRGALADGALKIGERGPEVTKLQESLIQLGINDHVKQPVKADGVFGPDTQRAVQAFQLWHGIDQVNGIADRQTMAAINTQAGLAIIQRSADQVHGVPARDFVANVGIAARIDPEAAANPRDVGYTPASVVAPAPVQPAPLTPKAEPVAPAVGPTTAPGRSEPTVDAVRLSPSDQAMFAKIRGKVSTDIPDETVAAAMLAAKRNGIPDAESIGPVGVANGTLWVSAHTPGFHTGVSVTAPAPPMQDTLRETQSFNQQRDQQLSQEAAQRGQDDPNRGPRM